MNKELTLYQFHLYLTRFHHHLPVELSGEKRQPITPCVLNQYKASGSLVYSLVSAILKVMAQLKMLYSDWLDQLLVSWIR